MEFIELSAQQKFTVIQRQLDDLGYLTSINRIITGKRYKVRRSAKSFIIKLYKQHGSNSIGKAG